MYYFVGLFAVGFLIIVHEGGHYFVARWCKMHVEQFSIGFGPGLLKWKARNGTTFQLAPILFGGFVHIRGMNIAEDVDPDDKYAYPNRPTWQRFATIFAGPATNYLSAIVVAMVLFTCHGLDVPRWYGVDEVMEGFDARGKLEHGDRILEINHAPLIIGEGASLTERVKASKGAPITVTVERNGERRDVTITPKLDHDGADSVWRIGVKPEPITLNVDIGVVEAGRRALSYPVDQTKAFIGGLYGIIFGNDKADPGGPIRMVKEFQKAFSFSWVRGIELLMALSVWLGLLNFLPVPALDGGRLVFLTYELVTRRRANPKIETMVHMAGIMALGVVMLLVLIVDIKKFF